MIHFGADENLDGRIYDALLRAQPDLDVVRVQDVGLSGADDGDVLAWAASEGRVLLTGDRQTLIGLAYERVRSGVAMPGVAIVRRDVSIGSTVNDLLTLAGASQAEEWEGQVIYLPI